MNGFSLIQILVVMAILSILAVASIYSFRSYGLSAKRVQAISEIYSIKLAQDRYRSTNSQYGSLAQVWGGVTSIADGDYSVSLSNLSSTGYTITATAQGSQANDTEDGVACNVLTLTISQGNETKTPAQCW